MGEPERAEAAAVALRSHGAISAPPGTKPADLAAVVGRLQRRREEPALIAWARQRQLLLPSAPFERAWEAGGRMEGAEHVACRPTGVAIRVPECAETSLTKNLPRCSRAKPVD